MLFIFKQCLTANHFLRIHTSDRYLPSLRNSKVYYDFINTLSRNYESICALQFEYLERAPKLNLLFLFYYLNKSICVTGNHVISSNLLTNWLTNKIFIFNNGVFMAADLFHWLGISQFKTIKNAQKFTYHNFFSQRITGFA